MTQTKQNKLTDLQEAQGIKCIYCYKLIAIEGGVIPLGNSAEQPQCNVKAQHTVTFRDELYLALASNPSLVDIEIRNGKIRYQYKKTANIISKYADAIIAKLDSEAQNESE